MKPVHFDPPMKTEPMEQLLISGLAVAMALACMVIAATEWRPAYELRSMRLIQERFGRPAARITLLILAAILFAAAATIWMGVRPAYATAIRRMHAIHIA